MQLSQALTPLRKLVLLFPAVVWLVVSLWYQAGMPAREIVAQSLTQETWEIPNQRESPLLLIIDYPKHLLLDSPEKAGYSLSVALLEVTPKPTRSFTPTLTPNELAQLNLSSTATPAFTVTPSTLAPVIIQLFPAEERLIFTDKQGVSIHPRLVLTPAKYAVTPSTLYLHPVIPPADNQPTTVEIGLSVSDSEFSPPALTTEVVIGIESTRESWWRHFTDLVFGKPITIGALMGLIITFGLQQYSKFQEEQRKEEKEKGKQVGKQQKEEHRKKLEQKLWKVRRQVRSEIRQLQEGGEMISGETLNERKCIQEGIRFLGIPKNPFGSEFLEDVEMVAYDLIQELDLLHEGIPVIVFNVPDEDDRTAIALAFVRYILREKNYFPVYHLISKDFQFGEAAREIAWTILHYFAVNPSDYCDVTSSIQAKIAHLLAITFGGTGNVLLELKKAGLSHTSTGEEMQKKVKQFVDEISLDEDFGEMDCLDLLEDICPKDFSSIALVLDWQAMKSSTHERYQYSSLTKISILYKIGISTKAILPEEDQSVLPMLGDIPIEMLQWEWPPKVLRYILIRTLTRYGDSGIYSWCNQESKRLAPDDRLVAAANGTPAGLIRTGNDLLCRIGEKQALLTPGDLDEILVPYNLPSGIQE